MFSLRTLFLAVAVAALGSAALFAQTRLWTTAFVGVALTIIIGATVVAIYRKTLATGVFSGVAWLYMVMLSSHLPLLQVYSPTTTLLIELWQASHKNSAPTPPPSNPVLTPPVYTPGYGSGYGGGGSLSFSYVAAKEQNPYDPAILSGFTDASDPKFLHYYASGQMLCTLIVALVASQAAAFFLGPKRTE